MPNHLPPAESSTRREFLKAGAAAGVLAAFAGSAAVGGEPVGSRVGAAALGERESRRARNVIFVVVDGMDHASISLMDTLLRRRDGRPSHYAELVVAPETTIGRCMTHARDSLVTDSAAAGSAFGCGEHIDNGAINFVDGREPTPILVRARDAGMATGLVTTTRITHATPAGMSCNVPSRGLEDAIAEQLLDRRFDVLLGGGAKHFPATLLEKHGSVTVARDAAGLSSAGSGRLLGIFDDDHMRYTLDRPETQPSLAEMTRAALARLADAPRGFLMQIEAGRVDHAGHANDIAALVHDMLAFDEMLEVVTGFADARDDTLVIVTADHGTGGPQLTLYGEAAARGLERLGNARRSFEWITEEAGGWRGFIESPARAREVIEHAAGFDPGEERVAWLADRIGALYSRAGRGDGFDARASATALLGSVLSNGFAVAFTSVNHNADYVEVLARGPGSERLGRIIDNVDIHRLMCEQVGLPLA